MCENTPVLKTRNNMPIGKKLRKGQTYGSAYKGTDWQIQLIHVPTDYGSVWLVKFDSRRFSTKLIKIKSLYTRILKLIGPDKQKSGNNF